MDSSIAHEEVTGGYYPTMRLFRLLIETLKPAVEAEMRGEPIRFLKPPSVRERNNQQIVTVYPSNLGDKLLFPGVTAETYIMPDHELTQGTELLQSKERGIGHVSLVLGAGNQSSIPFMDSLYKLFNQNQVVFLKHNPVAEWIYPIIDSVMAPFIELDYFHHAKGGVELGKFLCEECDNVHITGSDKTHDAIVWNGKDKHTNEPVFNKEITSELGCVSPVVIVPGNWSRAEIEYVAQHIAGGVINNNSYNCNASKLLVMQRNWDKRDDLIEEIKDILSKSPLRYAYYPGSKQRYDNYLKNYPNAEKLGEGEDENHLPWLLIRNVPAEENEYALCHEPFAPILSEVLLDSETVEEFLNDATQFCNEKVWGNLSMSLFIDPVTESKYKEELEQTIDNLRYGGISINAWSAIVYALGTPVWGAYPGNDIRNIQSGRGFVHNTYLLDNPQKSVVRAPFMLLFGSKYPYFPSHKNAKNFSNALANYERSPGVFSFITAMWNALWG